MLLVEAENSETVFQNLDKYRRICLLFIISFIYVFIFVVSVKDLYLLPDSLVPCEPDRSSGPLMWNSRPQVTEPPTDMIKFFISLFKLCTVFNFYSKMLLC